MDRFIQRLNIEHFERLLLTVTDESVRQRISMLLDEERAKKPADADKLRSSAAAAFALLSAGRDGGARGTLPAFPPHPAGLT